MMDGFLDNFMVGARQALRGFLKYPRFLVEVFVATVAAQVAALQELRSRQCVHAELYMIAGEREPQHQDRNAYGYSYLVVWLGCRDCNEEWKVQGRTPGAFSAYPNIKNVYRDAMR
jgi:hypothetical protein